VLGQREGVVREIRPVEIHGSRHVDVTVAYPDGSAESARLGAESVPEGLAAEERVLVSRAVNMIVAIERV
jgi:hypothetical protein